MSKRTSYHVTYNKSAQSWQVSKAGSDRASANRDTQAQAIDTARGFAQNAGRGQVVVHRKDNGQIRTEFTYQDDPNPPKG